MSHWQTFRRSYVEGFREEARRTWIIVAALIVICLAYWIVA